MATATYPPPPPYYRLYKNYSENPNSAPEPPPPIEGTYVCFGSNYTTEDVLPSLEEQGVPQLYPKDSNVDYKKELRSLNRELQLHILELADVLVERPSQYAKRIGEISSIFKNLHHLLNSLRPHQARATLIHIMELQILQRKQAVEDIKRRREEAQRLLKDAFVLSLAELRGVPFPTLKVQTLTLETTFTRSVVPDIARLLQNSPGLKKLIAHPTAGGEIEDEDMDRYLVAQGLGPDQCWRSEYGVFPSSQEFRAMESSREDAELKLVVASFVEMVLRNVKTLETLGVTFKHIYRLRDPKWFQEFLQMPPTLPNNNNVSIVLRR
ncbi:unnamed protein product [Thlaspi arvense]|uniref:Mediator of RNA polymerase II transcription subunit 7 n=1 Tax=Thlaspi arvense TaxID=13288 RepID=A0AAU9SWF4_THLAR|nr:unnamed protein product [Thlaspi arvense]